MKVGGLPAKKEERRERRHNDRKQWIGIVTTMISLNGAVTLKMFTAVLVISMFINTPRQLPPLHSMQRLLGQVVKELFTTS
jgi:hypothetical protein